MIAYCKKTDKPSKQEKIDEARKQQTNTDY